MQVSLKFQLEIQVISMGINSVTGSHQLIMFVPSSHLFHCVHFEPQIKWESDIPAFTLH